MIHRRPGNFFVASESFLDHVTRSRRRSTDLVSRSFSSNDDLPKMLAKALRVSAPLTFTYKIVPYSPKPLHLALDVHIPSKLASTSSRSVVPSPTLFLIHQGGFTNKSKSNLPPWLLDLAYEKGWIVVAPNYRLLVGGLAKESDGGTKVERDGLRGVDLGASLDDVLRAYEWSVGGELDRVLRDGHEGMNLKVDLAKVVVVGMSAGESSCFFLSLPSRSFFLAL